MNNKTKWTTSRIVKLVFIILFAISTIAFCFMPLGFDIKDDDLERLFIAGMFADCALWVISLFGFLICLLLDQIKKNNPEKYVRLFPASENANFFKKIWESPLILLILTFVFLIVGEIVCVALNNMTNTIIYLVIEATCIISGLIFDMKKLALSKRLFCAVVIGFVVASIVILIFTMTPIGSGKCPYCGGRGYFGGGSYGEMVDCPDC